MTNPYVEALEELLSKITDPGPVQEGQRRGVRRAIQEVNKVWLGTQPEDAIDEFNREWAFEGIMADLLPDGKVMISSQRSARVNVIDSVALLQRESDRLATIRDGE